MGETPKVGDTAYDFKLPASNGEDISLKGMLETGGVMLVFFRGLY